MLSSKESGVIFIKIKIKSCVADSKQATEQSSNNLAKHFLTHTLEPYSVKPKR